MAPDSMKNLGFQDREPESKVEGAGREGVDGANRK